MDPKDANPTPDPKPALEPKPDKPKPSDKPAPEPPPEPTEEQRKAIAEAAIAEHTKKQAAAEEKKKREAEAKAAEERGEFDKVKAALTAERDAERLKTRKAEALIELRDYLASDDKLAPYLPAATLIQKSVAVEPDTSPDDVTKSIKAAVAEYVKLLPVQPKPAPGGGARPAPGAGVKGPTLRTGTAPGATEKDDNSKSLKSLSLLTRGF